MPRRDRWWARNVGIVVIAVVVAVAVIVGGVLFARRQHTAKHASTTTTTPGPEPTGPVTFPTFASKLGLTTGVQLWSASTAQQDTEIAGIAATGARWLRTALSWRDVEPSSADQDDWSKADNIVADAQKDHVSIIFDVVGAPRWAGSQESGEFSTDPQQYADFCAKVAARYRGRVQVYELGNEPNLTTEVPNPDPATYAKVLEAAYPAIKKADPDAFVLTAGLAGGRHRNGNLTGIDFLTGLYADGAQGSFDGIAFHPYTYPLLPTQDVDNGTRNWAQMLQVRALMVRHGDGGKPIWVTEFGAPTNGPGGVSEAQQAEIMKNGFDLWKTYSWGGVISWFDYQDKGTDTSTHKDFFGIVDASLAHKPSYATFSAIAHG
jgi:hypothetical protein